MIFQPENFSSYGLTATAAMPGATMRIYMGEPVDGRVAESVKIGDPLTLVTNLTCRNNIIVCHSF